uniref:Titin n=1 Tax=Mesocestoides corti TaxID=53468 RepID=A0A5K3ENA8_MESCO
MASNGIAPKFTEQTKIRKIGKDVEFECILESQPIGDVKWSKDGVPIMSGGRYTINTVSNGSRHILTLRIAEITANDGGEYLVLSKNPSGEATANIKLNLGQAKTQIKAPKFPDKPVIRKDPISGEIVLYCRLEGNPKPELAYFLNEKPISPKPGKLTFVYTDAGPEAYNCEIRIANPTLDDSGSYKIKAFNAGGESNAFANLNLSSKPSAEMAPKFDPPSVRKEGKAIIVETTCTGCPAPAFHWTKGALELKPKTGKFEMTEKSEEQKFIQILRILNFSEADADVYTCRAKNTVGEAKAVHTIKVPKVLDSPNVTYRATKALVELLVDSGDDVPNIVWRKNGRTFTADNRFKMTVHAEGTKRFVTLTVDPVTDSDNGTYECEVTNSYGSTKVQFVIKAEKEKGNMPKLTSKPSDVSENEGSTMSLGCSYDGATTPEVKFLHLGVDISSDPRVIIKVDHPSKSINVTTRTLKLEDTGPHTVQLLSGGKICDTANFYLTVVEKHIAFRLTQASTILSCSLRMHHPPAHPKALHIFDFLCRK